MPGDKSGEDVAGEKAVGASCCLPLYWGLPDFGIQCDEDSSMRFCSGIMKIITRRAPAMPYRGPP